MIIPIRLNRAITRNTRIFVVTPFTSSLQLGSLTTGFILVMTTIKTMARARRIKQIMSFAIIIKYLVKHHFKTTVLSLEITTESFITVFISSFVLPRYTSIGSILGLFKNIPIKRPAANIIIMPSAVISVLLLAPIKIAPIIKKMILIITSISKIFIVP